MNILYHHRTQASGAAGHHIREMVRAFEELGHSVDIIAPPGVGSSLAGQVDPAAKKRRYSMPQAIFEIFEIIYNLVDVVRLAHRARSRKYNLIYERYAIFNIAGIAISKLFKIPIVIEVSFTSKTEVFPIRTRILASLAALCDRFVFNKADRVVVVSSVLKEGIVADFGAPGEKISVLPNAVDPKRFDADVHNGKIRGRYRLRSNKVIGFMGGFYPWHGLDLLVSAAGAVLKGCPEARFLLVGDGPVIEDLRRRVSSNGLGKTVIFTGYVPHDRLPEYISSFDIGVMPHSNAYGSPMKIFEYMAMGKPVVAPRLKPIEEVIENGENGLLFEAGSDRGMADSILRLLTDKDLYAKVSANSRKGVLARHTWTKNAESVLSRVAS